MTIDEKVQGGEKPNLLMKITLLTGLVFGTYVISQNIYKEITRQRIYHVEKNQGRAAAIEYARDLVGPLKVTVTQEVLNIVQHSGKKEAALIYLGFRKLEDIK